MGSPNSRRAFHGAPPVAQRSGAAQAALSASTVVAPATTAATNSSPYGYSQAQADAIRAAVTQLIAENLTQITLINELRAALAEKGLIKGA